MVRYSFQEQAEMVFVYGQAGGNGREAAGMYRATYPDRQHQPHHTKCGTIHPRFCEHGYHWDHFEHLLWRGFRPCAVCHGCISGHKAIRTFMLDIQSGITPWSKFPEDVIFLRNLWSDCYAFLVLFWKRHKMGSRCVCVCVQFWSPPSISKPVIRLIRNFGYI